MKQSIIFWGIILLCMTSIKGQIVEKINAVSKFEKKIKSDVMSKTVVLSDIKENILYSEKGVNYAAASSRACLDNFRIANKEAALFYTTFDFVDTSKITIVDNNADGVTWKILNKGDISPGYLGDIDPLLKYGYSSKNPGDDYVLNRESLRLQAGTYNISFYYRKTMSNYSEALGVYFGMSKEVNSLEKIAELVNINNHNWFFLSVDIEVVNEGDYYFAIKAESEADMIAIAIDELTFGKGKYEGRSRMDIIGIEFPISGCDLNTSNDLSVTFINIGTKVAPSVEMSFKINDDVLVTETFPDTVGMQDTITLTFEQTIDLSMLNEYNIDIWTKGNDVNSIEDSMRFFTRHALPLTIPYKSDFTDTLSSSIKDWVSMYENGWEYSTKSLAYEYISKKSPLISNCVDFKSFGKHRFSFDYMAGITFMEIYTYPGGVDILMGEQGKDISTFDTILKLYEFTPEIVTRGVDFYITDTTKKYVFAFTNVFEYVQIHNVSIENVKNYDLRINSAFVDVPLKLPLSHIKGVERNISAEIENRGALYQDSIRFTLKRGEELLLESDFVDAESGDVSILDANLIMDELSLIDSLINFTFEVISPKDDVMKEDNKMDYKFAISDTSLIFDNCNDFTTGAGATGGELSFGTIYDLKVRDTLTSVDLGFGIDDEDLAKHPFKFSVYTVNMSADGVYLKGEKIVSKEYLRGYGGDFQNFKFNPTVLEPDKYIFAVEQVIKGNIMLVYDGNPTGEIYIFDMTNDTLYINNEWGYLGIRPYFGNNAKVITEDVFVKEITKPDDLGVFAANQKIEAIVANAGRTKLTNVPVVLQVGDKVEETIIDEMEAFEEIKVNFTVDLSKPNEYELIIFTNLTSDGNRANDTIKRMVECVDISNPYKMDFELTLNFAIDDFLPAWQAIDYDNAISLGIENLNFPNQDVPFAFIAFNQEALGKDLGLDPYAGKRFGASFVIGETKANDDWFISPKLKLGINSQFEFYRRSYTVEYGEEVYNVLVSTTGTKKSDFTTLKAGVKAGEEWEKESVDLSTYDNKEVHVAIQCISHNKFVFMIDNLEIITNHEYTSNDFHKTYDNIKLYPNPAFDFVQICTNGINIEEVSIYNIVGLLMFTSSKHKNQSNMLIDVSGFVSGIYFAKIKTLTSETIVKFIVK